MKHTLLYIAAGLLGAVALTACDEDFQRPPVIMPPCYEYEANYTIADLRADYWSKLETPVIIPYAENGDTLIVTGRVCSSDKTGNIYKSIVVQQVDENNNQVAAIALSVNDSEIYKLFPYGQEVAIKVSGLAIGSYASSSGKFSGLLQLGTYSGEGGVAYMSTDQLKEHMVRNHEQMPYPEKVVATEVTINDIKGLTAGSDALNKWQSQLVTVKDVSWVEAHFAYASNASVNRHIIDEQGNFVAVRNSNYATFKAEPMPAGKGNVTAILSWYSGLQLTLIDTEGNQGFDAGTQLYAGVPEEGDGTAASPYNATRAYYNVVNGEYDSNKEVYITSTVLFVEEFNSQYGNYYLYLADPDGGNQILYIYRLLGENSAKLTAGAIKAGDVITLKGNLMEFNGAPQVGQGCTLVTSTNNGNGGTGEGAGTGTETDPYNCAKALELAQGLDANGQIADVCVKGKIAAISDFNTQYGNATYTISDDSGTFSIYRGKGINGAIFTNADELQVGAEVVVKGTIVNYKGNTPQMTAGSELVSYTPAN